MDPLSVLGVTASIIACIQLTAALLKRTGPSDHNKADLERILQVVTGFSGAYEALKWYLQSNENDAIRLSTLQHLEAPLKDSKAVLEFLHKRLQNPGLMNQYVFGGSWDGKLKKVLKRLEDSKALFELALHSDQHIILTAVEIYIRNAAEDIRDVKDIVRDSNSRLMLLEKSSMDNHEEAMGLHSQTTGDISRISKQVQEVGEDLQQQEKNQAKEEFIRWLTKVDPATDHNFAYSKHQSGTGEWLLKSQDYVEWREQPGSFLWLHGIPGCGKSTLCSTIIENMMSYSTVNLSCSVAFFYFTFRDMKKQEISYLLYSLVAQLAAQSDNFSEDMQKLYHRHSPGEPPLDALKNMLRSILQQDGDKYVIIDALDECPTDEGRRDQLCALILEISKWKLPLLHILTTSREEPDIERTFSQNQNIKRVPLRNSLVDPDIRCYVEAQLVQVPRLASWPPEVKEEIREALVGGAHGMFKWASCR